MQGGDNRYGGRGRTSMYYGPNTYGKDDPYSRFDSSSNDRSLDKRYRSDPYSRDDSGDELGNMSPYMSRNNSNYNKSGNGYSMPRSDDIYDRGRPSVAVGLDMAVPASGMVAVYELDHLATFTVSPKLGMIKPTDGIRRLREMESTTGIWAMRVQLRLDRREIVIVEASTQKEIECFPISRVSNPTCIADSTIDDLYNNVVLFTVQPDSARQPAEMHLFQCIRKPGQELVDDIDAAMSGRFPRRPAVRDKPVVDSPRSMSDGNRSLRSSLDDLRQLDRAPKPQRQLHGDGYQRNPVKEESNPDDVILLNHCFDDIEGFVASLQQAANAQKELERRRQMNPGRQDPAEEMLRMRAQAPPLKQFVDTLQKFKLAFNLLPKLTSVLKDPDAVSLLRMIFSPLALVIDASRDDRGQPTVATKVETPLLTNEACQMLDTHLTPQEIHLWRSLGPAWTIPSNKWQGVLPPYYPVFSDGWHHSGSNLEDVGITHPSAGSYTNNQYAQPPRQVSEPAPYQQQPQQPPSQPQTNQGPPGGQPNPSFNIDPTQYRYLNELKAKGIRIYVVANSRDGKNQKELTVKVGDVLEVLDSSKNWWKVKNYLDNVGFVPNTILKPYSD